MNTKDKNLVADALEFYGNALRHAAELLAVTRNQSAVLLADRGRRCHEIAIALNQHTGRTTGEVGVTPDPFRDDA